MPTTISAKRTVVVPRTTADTNEKLIRVRLRSLEIPPIKDGLVIGTEAPISGEAIIRMLKLMTVEKFDRITVRDDRVQEIIFRSATLRKMGRERAIAFVMNRVRPLMTETELLMLDIDIELVLDDVL